MGKCIFFWLAGGITAFFSVSAAAAGAPLLDAYKIRFDPLNSGSRASFRGLSAVDEKIAWVSGSGGSVLITQDAGESWHPKKIPGADSLDFRDVEAFENGTAYVVSAGPGDKSRIYKTIDSGETWQLQFTNQFEDGFFDGAAFWDEAHGMAYSDPVDGHVLIVTTDDGGNTWKRMATDKLPPVQDGEYSFAASGTGIVVADNTHVWIASGGSAARVFHSADRGHTWSVSATPIRSGSPSSGIFSIAFRDANHGVAVGGDFRNPKETGSNVAVTRDGGKSWLKADDEGLVDFRSGVVYVPAHPGLLIAVGSDGTGYSEDGGLTWSAIDTIGYHTLSFGASAESGWAAGSDGRIAKCVVEKADR